MRPEYRSACDKIRGVGLAPIAVVTRRWREMIDNNGNFVGTRVASLVRWRDRHRGIPALLGRAKGSLDDRIGLRTPLSAMGICSLLFLHKLKIKPHFQHNPCLRENICTNCQLPSAKTRLADLV